MKYSPEIEAKLSKQLLKCKRVDIAFTVFSLQLLVFLFFGIFMVWRQELPVASMDFLAYLFSGVGTQEAVTGGYSLILMGALVVIIWGRFVKTLGPYIEDRWVPRYIVVTEGGVRKLYGSPLAYYQYVYPRLLMPGFKTYEGNARVKYGCTLAAVPLTQEDMKVKAELDELGIDMPNLFG